MHTWQMQTAKSQMAALIKQANEQGPQEITVHGRSVAVVLSRDSYDQLTQNQASLPAFMRRSPLYGEAEIDLERDPSPTRDIDI